MDFKWIYLIMHSLYRVSLICSCSMHLALFPMDEQTCHLNVASCKYNKMVLLIFIHIVQKIQWIRVRSIWDCDMDPISDTAPTKIGIQIRILPLTMEGSGSGFDWDSHSEFRSNWYIDRYPIPDLHPIVTVNGIWLRILAPTMKGSGSGLW